MARRFQITLTIDTDDIETTDHCPETEYHAAEMWWTEKVDSLSEFYQQAVYREPNVADVNVQCIEVLEGPECAHDWLYLERNSTKRMCKECGDIQSRDVLKITTAGPVYSAWENLE